VSGTRQGKRYSVPGVEFYECPNCGEQIYDPAAMRQIEKRLKSSFVTANKLVEQFVKLDILKETTGGQRNRRYSYIPYLALFESSATADHVMREATKF